MISGKWCGSLSMQLMLLSQFGPKREGLEMRYSLLGDGIGPK